MRYKIYRQCDVESILNFGETHPKYMIEIIRALNNNDNATLLDEAKRNHKYKVIIYFMTHGLS
jgi:hypothetical protein